MFTKTSLSCLVLCVISGKVIGQKYAKKYCSELQPLAPSGPAIIGGDNTTEGEFPHMAALGYEDLNNPTWSCGGSLITPEFVLTAGHCADTLRGKVLKVRLGSRTLKKPSVGYEDIDVEEIIVHPNFQPPSQYNDIAILKLAKGVTFSDNIFPICLHSRVTITSKNLTAIGWGTTIFAGPKSNELLKVGLPRFARGQCNQFHKHSAETLPRGIDNKLQLCAGSDSEKEKDTCQGDSGGPLGYKKGHQHYIGGITSLGKNCGLAPGIYTRVSAYVPWIESIVWRDEYNIN